MLYRNLKGVAVGEAGPRKCFSYGSVQNPGTQGPQQPPLGPHVQIQVRARTPAPV